MRTVNRSYTPRTTRLLSEYLAQNFATAHRIQEMHLTLANPQAVARAGGDVSPRFGSVTVGYADAAVILPGEVQLWEAKAQVDPAAVGQLLHYAQIFPETVEGRQYAGRRVTLHLLAARDKPTARVLAEAQGVHVVIYSPAWYDASIAAGERLTASRKLDAAAAIIIDQILQGSISEIAGIAELEGLGLTHDAAVQRIENARKPAPGAGETGAST